MDYDTLQLEEWPDLTAPMVIVGFRGWGDALEVSSGVVAHMTDALQGIPFGRLDADRCYRYDLLRPVTDIQEGRMRALTLPGGVLSAIRTPPDENDLLTLVADEPHLNWNRFAKDLVDLAHTLGSPAVITVGSMFDHVLHTDRIVSAVTTGDDFDGILRRREVVPIAYHGPGAIHTLILEACRRQGVTGASLWCHCPAYLQGISHHGMMIHLGRVVADIAGCSFPTTLLETRWQALEKQIGELIAGNPKLAEAIDRIRRKQREEALPRREPQSNAPGNVIHLRDFIDP